MKVKKLPYSALVVLFVVTASIRGYAQDGETGVWDVQTLGSAETMTFDIREDGTMFLADSEEAARYDTRTGIVDIPGFGRLKMRRSGGELFFYFAEVGDDNPMLASFLSAMRIDPKNQVEELWLDALTYAIRNVVATPPIMIGKRAR